MPVKPLKYKSKIIRPHKAVISPDINKKSILVDNPWEYVELWIKRRGNNSDALFYWNQAKSFYKATKSLPNTSAPLTAYYCFLNATKALLEVKNINYVEKHGVTGSKSGVTSLSNEKIKFSPTGVLSELCRLFGDSVNNEEYSFRNLIYNLSFVHRAYDITYSSSVELFFPISNPQFVKIQGQNYAYFQAEITAANYQNGNTINKLPTSFERDLGSPNKYIIRKKKRFKWLSGAKNSSTNLNNFMAYNKKVRKDIHYIQGSTDLWYFKRGGVADLIDRHPLTIVFALMHRLSELSRYDPLRLKNHFDCQHNWLLSEFINLAPRQYIYGIACEITGREFRTPGIRK